MSRAPSSDEVAARESVLVTGFPAFTARRMVKKILRADDTARVFLLVRDEFTRQAREMIDSLSAQQTGRVDTVVGDVCDMDLGLAGDEYKTLADEVTTIQHLAGIYYTGVDERTARRVNVEGTRGVIELAAETKRLRRLCHWSTAAVSGKRKGVILEEELDEGQSFHNFWEATKFEAEKLVRAAQRKLPITILRPGLIVGDSSSGEIDKFDGPYYLMVLIANNVLHLRLPLPGRGAAPLNVVPIDFVIDAAHALSIDERAAGGTFHLTDPNPLSARKVYELVAEHSETRAPKGFFPAGIARTLLRTPGIDRLARKPLALLDSLDQYTFYNSRNTSSLLADQGIACPPFDSYVDRLVRYVRNVHAARRQQLDDEVFDPFD
jgi:thioester reductase-like protein